MSLETFVRHPSTETKLHLCASFPQTLLFLLACHHYYFKIASFLSLPAVSLSNNPLSLVCFSAKSLQEFAAVLQNLEDERTRMVSATALK